MSKILYGKENPRLTVKFINGDTNELLFEVPNRTCLDIGDLMSDYNVSELMKKHKVEASIVRVLVVADYYKQ